MFITFEGIDCSGKSTQARILAETLRNEGYDVVELREPGNTDLSEHIREMLLGKEFTNMDQRTELLLFAASRAQLVSEVVLPSLHEGKVVICDRFSDSTIAYQGYGRGLPLDEIIHINRIASQETSPDMTFYLDVSPETSMRRCQERDSSGQDRIEEEGIHFYEKVINGYMHLANAHADRYFVVDGGKEQDDISEIIRHLTLDMMSVRSNYSVGQNGMLEPMMM